jgi:hypothetical protein
MYPEYNGRKIMLPENERLARRMCEFFDYCFSAGYKIALEEHGLPYGN